MPGAVVVVQGTRDWPEDLLATISREGHYLLHVADVRLVPFFVLAGGVMAVLVDTRALETLGLMTLRRCRECSPETAVIAVAADAAVATIKRALDGGATAFVTWPAPPQVVAQALRSGSR